MKNTRIVIFAKTRLIPALANALKANVGPVELCITPGIDDPAWRSLTLPRNIEYSSQGDGDLGARLSRAAERVVTGGESILLIGTDIPELDATQLRRAAALLREADATLFPTADGGYALLGLNRFHPLLFDCIPWSSDVVAFSTICRIGRLGWSVRNGTMLHDIDTPDDLKWLPDEWQEPLIETENSM